MGERVKQVRHSLGVLNTNLRYIYMEVVMSPLSVMQAPYLRKVGGVKYQPLDTGTQSVSRRKRALLSV